MAVGSLRPKAEDFEIKWKELEHHILSILTMETISKLEWDYCFADIYQLCVAIPEPLTIKLHDAISACLTKYVADLADKLTTLQGEDLIQNYNVLWKQYHKSASYLHNLFTFLNKTIKPKSQPVNNDMANLDAGNTIERKEIGCLSLDIWRDVMLCQIEKRLSNALLNIVSEHRKGNSCQYIDATFEAVQSFVMIDEYRVDRMQTRQIQSFATDPSSLVRQYYCENFEKLYLAETETYCDLLIASEFVNLTFADYMKKVIDQIEKERRRAKMFLHQTSEIKIHNLCSKLLVDRNKAKFDENIKRILYEKDEKNLKNLYILLEPIKPHGLTKLLAEFEEKIKEEGLKKVWFDQTEITPQAFVSNIIEVHTKYNGMVINIFNGLNEFVSALEKAMNHIVNHKEDPKLLPRASEKLSRYTDNLLRKNRNTNEMDIEQSLSNAIIIFKFIEDKDSFQKYYSKMLSNRLIYNLSSNHENEECMILKLKETCGYEFTSKLSRMFADISASKDLTIEFLDTEKVKNSHGENSINFNVLQACAWPYNSTFTNTNNLGSTEGQPTTPVPLNVSSTLKTSIGDFESFYDKKHNGRKLCWLYHMFSVDIKYFTPVKIYIISMSLNQSSIWLEFENVDEMSVDEMVQRTSLPLDIVVKNLRIFVDQFLLLANAPLFDGNTLISLNKNYQGKRLKFRLPQPQQQKLIEKEIEQISSDIMHDRKYYMECAIVRIMKTRKTMKHAALVNEVIEQTKNRFSPDMAFIKTNIESLIEKLYLQRTEKNKDEYHYLA
uniref:CULLIN_2 domain-containing protein n=1 Tax=Rhabditophanes sp. KR3021 TaxID=114890 RepID=A0AC35U025_9BILA